MVKNFSLRKELLLAVVYCLLMLWCLLLFARGGSWSDRGIFDVIADIGGGKGSTNQLMFMFVAIPVLVTILFLLIEKMEKPLSVITFGSHFRLWHTHVTAAICFSFLLTCFVMVISFCIGGLLVGLENSWLSPSGTISILFNDEAEFQEIIPHIATGKIIATIFITKFAGFLMISFCVLILKQFLKMALLS
ncbi:hypothetical protein J9303_15815 [Bacillaceae bacterium Marseille-Q3522]|nr:hypothetical protein [Bacillaceae bacterium Marseille-Q3522]